MDVDAELDKATWFPDQVTDYTKQGVRHPVVNACLALEKISPSFVRKLERIVHEETFELDEKSLEKFKQQWRDDCQDKYFVEISNYTRFHLNDPYKLNKLTNFFVVGRDATIQTVDQWFQERKYWYNGKQFHGEYDFCKFLVMSKTYGCQFNPEDDVPLDPKHYFHVYISRFVPPVENAK